jgi:hypothetical protein
MSIELNKSLGLYKFRVIDSELMRKGYKDIKGIYWQEDKHFVMKSDIYIKQICSRGFVVYSNKIN